MLEGIIQRVLLALFGRFIDGLDKKQINFSFLKGNLVIENVSIKKEALEALQLPIELVYSSIQRIEILLPWNRLDTQRTEIKIHSVFLLVTTLSEEVWCLDEINYYKPKAQQIEAYIKKVIEEESRKQEQTTDDMGQQQPAGFLLRQITRIVDNLYVSISDVHLRYEHCISKHSFSWGITINHITQQTVDSEWKQTACIHERKDNNFVNKLIQLSKLTMYWNSDDHLLIIGSIIKPEFEKNIEIPQDKDPYKINFKIRQRRIYKIDEKMQAKISQRLQQELVYEPNNPNMGFQTAKSTKYIFCLNAAANVVQTYNHQRKVPEYKIKVELQEMDFKIKHTQYQEILKLVQIFNLYQYRAKQQMDLYLTSVIKPQQSNYKDMNILYTRHLFQYLVKSQILENRRKRFLEFQMRALQKKTTPAALLKKSYVEARQYQQIVMKTTVSTLQMWAKQSLEIFERAKAHNQIEQALSKEIERAYKPMSLVDEETYIYLEFRLLIQKGSLKLLRKHKSLEEGFTLIWKCFDFNLQKRKNNFEVEQVVQDMEVQMFSVEEKNDIIVPIVKKIRSYDLQEKPLVYFKLEKHPLSRPNYFTSVQLEVQKIEIMVFVASLRRVIAYFRMPPQEQQQQESNSDKVKKTAKEKEAEQEKKIETTTKNYISITIQSPIVIVPNQQINDLHSDCWVLKLGDLDIITVDERIPAGFVKLGSDQYKKLGISGESIGRGSRIVEQSRISEQPLLTVHNEKNQIVGHFNFQNVSGLERSSQPQVVPPPPKKAHKSLNYDNYTMKLQSVQLQYFSSVHYFYNYQKLSTTAQGREILNNNLRVRSRKYDVLEEFSMQLNLYFKKNTLQHLPNTKINFELPYLKASINPDVPYTFQKLLQTINDYSQDQSLSSILQQEKSKLIKYSSCKGILRKRGKFLRSWSSYFAVLSGWYIYLYQNESDLDYNQYISLRDVTVLEAQQDIGVLNSFKIKSKKEVIYFQSRSTQEKNRWFKFIQQKIHDMKSKINTVKVGSENTVPQQVDKSRQEPITRPQPNKEGDELQTKYRFQIKKFLIELQYDQRSEILIQFDSIKLQSLSGLSQTYQEFTISSISIEDRGQSMLRSVHYSQPNTPAVLKQKGQKIQENRLQRKIRRMIEFKQEESKFLGAVRVRLSQVDPLQITQASTYMIIQLAALEAHYQNHFLSKLSLFMVKPSQQQKSKDNSTDISEFGDPQVMMYTQVPVTSDTRFTRYEMTKNNIKSVRSFTLQKSSVSDSEMHEHESSEKLPDNIIKVTIVNQEIKLIVLMKMEERDKPQEFLQIQVNEIGAKLKITDEQYQIEGNIQRIEIVDLKSLPGAKHVFLGKKDKSDKKYKQKKVSLGLTIFSNTKKQSEKQMVEFKYLKCKNPAGNENIQDDVALTVRDCFIDYLNATIMKVLQLLQSNDTKKQNHSSDVEQDLELIKQKLNSPALFKIHILLENPKILIKPANQISQSFELQIKQVSFELDASKEKNRVIEFSVRANKKQSQVVNQLDSLWCQTMVVSADTMRILIRNQSDLQFISNSFSGVLRIQTPMFITEYETLFPNLVLNKTQEMRIKVTDIQLNIMRNHYLFLLQVMQTQYEKQTQKQNQKRKESTQVKQNQLALIFKLSRITIRLMDECNEYAHYGQFQRSLIDLSLLDIVFQYKNDLHFTVSDFRSQYYQYKAKEDHVMVRIQHVMNNLTIEKRKLEQLLDEDEFEVKQKQVTDLSQEIKMEFYNEAQPSKVDIEDKLNVNGIFGSELNEISINIGEQKWLVNAYYVKTIADFFKIPKNESVEGSQLPQEKRAPQSQTLLRLHLKLSKSSLILHDESLKNCLVLETEATILMHDSYNDWYHRKYHKLNNDEYNPFQNDRNAKTRKLKIQLDVQLYNASYAIVQKQSNIMKRKWILYPITVTLLHYQFLCNCDKHYCNYNNGKVEQISTLITENTIKFNKIRMNISHNDYALMFQTIKFQKGQLKLCEGLFHDDQESSVNETIVRQLQIKPTIEAERSITRHDSKRRSAMVGSAFLRLKSSLLQNSALKDEVVQVFYGVGEQDMEVVREEDAQSEDFKQEKEEEQRPIVNFMKTQVILKAFEMVLVNDMNKSFAPLLLLKFQLKQLVVDQNHVSKALECIFKIGVLYFNPVASNMEPIMEPFISKMQMVQQNDGRLTLHSESPILNLNISSEMVLNLYKIFTQWQQLEQSEDEENFKRQESKRITRLPSMKGIPQTQDNVTLFSIANRCGYPIKVSKNGSDSVIELSNNETKNYEVQSHYEDYAKTFESDTRIGIRFGDVHMNSTNNVVINYAGVKKLQWEDQSQYYVVSTQIESLQKTIAIYSPYMLINQTDCAIQIKLSDTKIYKHFQLKPGEQIAIPQELYKDDCFIQIHFQDLKYNRHSQLSDPLFIKRLFNDMGVQIFHKPCYTLALQNTTVIQYVKYIEFKPAFVLYNLLPIPIQFMFHSTQNQDFHKLLVFHYKTATQDKQALSRGNSFTHLQNDMQDNMVRSVTVNELSNNAVIRVEAGMIEIVPQGELQLHCLEKNDHLSVNLHVSGFSLSAQFDVLTVNEVELKTEGGAKSSHILIDRDCVRQTKQVYFYIQTCIINTTNHKLKYYTFENGKPLLLAGQQRELQPDRDSFESNYEKIYITDPLKYLMLGVDESISNEVNVGLLGSVALQVKQKSKGYDQFYLNEFGIHISLANNVFRKGVYTKVIEIMPRYVIINKSGHALNICQSGFEQQYIQLKNTERIHLTWPDCRLEKSIRVQKQGKYSWSGELFISELRSTSFYSSAQPETSQQLSQFSYEQQKSRITEKSGIYKQFNLKKYDPQDLLTHKETLQMQTSMMQQPSQEFFKDCLFLTAEITKIKATNFILLEQQNEENTLYKLVNRCRPFKLYYGQDSYASVQEWVLDCDSSTPFSWEFPSHSFKLRVKFVHNNKTEHSIVLDFQQHQGLREITFGHYVIQIKSEFEGQTRVITFQQVNESQRNLTFSIQRESLDLHKLITVHLQQVGISIMTKRRGVLLEANYIHMNGIQMGVNQNEFETTAQLRIKFLNIDNNTSLDTTTPVLLTTRRFYQATHDSKYFFLDASCSLEHKVSAILLYNFIRIFIQPFTLQFDEEYVQVVLETVKQAQTFLQNSIELDYNGSPHSIKSLCFQTPQQRHYYLESMAQQHNTTNPCILWQSIEIGGSKKQVYMKEFVLSKIDMRFSFHKRFRNNSQFEENVFNLFSTAIGATVQNFNEAEIILDCFRLRSVYDSKEIVLQSIQDHYKSEIIRSILKIIGSIEIIGNPVKLVQQITNGIVDFVEMPIEGLRHGPLEFGLGICKGTGSLIKNTVAGAFYSVNKVTGSISASVSLLTMDDDYLEKRRIFMLKRPDHILDGLSQAGHCLYNGFSNGITGVVMHPYQEMQRDGLKGFVKGTFKGLSGLIVKPIAGVLDASAKAAEGVVSTATHFDDKPNDSRMRYPRIFYEKSKYFKKYVPMDAQLCNFLTTFMNGAYADIDLIGCFWQKESDAQLNSMQRQILSATKSIHECFKHTSKILVISYQYILVFENMTLHQEIKSTEIVEVFEPQNGTLRLSTEFTPNIDLNIQLEDTQEDKLTERQEIKNTEKSDEEEFEQSFDGITEEIVEEKKSKLRQAQKLLEFLKKQNKED